MDTSNFLFLLFYPILDLFQFGGQTVASYEFIPLSIPNPLCSFTCRGCLKMKCWWPICCTKKEIIHKVFVFNFFHNPILQQDLHKKDKAAALFSIPGSWPCSTRLQIIQSECTDKGNIWGWGFHEDMNSTHNQSYQIKA